MGKVWDKEADDWIEVGNPTEAVAIDPKRYSLTKPETSPATEPDDSPTRRRRGHR